MKSESRGCLLQHESVVLVNSFQIRHQNSNVYSYSSPTTLVKFVLTSTLQTVSYFRDEIVNVVGDGVAIVFPFSFSCFCYCFCACSPHRIDLFPKERRREAFRDY